MKLLRNAITTLCLLASCGLRGVDEKRLVPDSVERSQILSTAKEVAHANPESFYRGDFAFNQERENVIVCSNGKLEVNLDMVFLNGSTGARIEKSNGGFAISGIDGVVRTKQLVDLVLSLCGGFDRRFNRKNAIIDLGDNSLIADVLFRIVGDDETVEISVNIK